MAIKTDAAKELADLCRRLASLSQEMTGSQVLAEQFQVEPWSAEFYQLVFAVSRRIENLKTLVGSLDLDDDLREQAIQHLNTIQYAFTLNGLNNQWAHSVRNYISPEHVNPVLMLSSAVRPVQSYLQLTEQERAELLDATSQILSWLRQHQLNEQDFIRQLIIDGLEQFEFRVERVHWVGWGYPLDSLRDVLGAYMALERGLDPAAAPDGQALLMKLGAFFEVASAKIGVAKDIYEKGDWLFGLYKNLSAVLITHQGVVALLTGPAGG